MVVLVRVLDSEAFRSVVDAVAVVRTPPWAIEKGCVSFRREFGRTATVRRFLLGRVRVGFSQCAPGVAGAADY